jgi:transmembrane sensor
MHSISDVDTSLLARYLSGECTPEEASLVRQWAAADVEHAAQLNELTKVWADASIPPIQWDTQPMWDRIATRFPNDFDAGSRSHSVIKERQHVARHPINTARYRRLSAIAALFCVAFVAVIGIVVGFPKGEPTTEMHEYITHMAERATIDLPDGSRIILGPATTLRYPSSYGKTDRTLFVTGQAYIIATSNPKLPLVVNTVHTTTQVLGTTFSVRSYPEDHAVRVTVVDGKVALRLRNAKSGSGTVLTAGTQGMLDSAGLVSVVQGVDTSLFVSWKDGSLQFRQAPLITVIKDLERWYGTKIVLRNIPLDSSYVTASFGHLTRSADLTHLARALGVSYEQKGDTAIFTSTH